MRLHYSVFGFDTCYYEEDVDVTRMNACMHPNRRFRRRFKRYHLRDGMGPMR